MSDGDDLEHLLALTVEVRSAALNIAEDVGALKTVMLKIAEIAVRHQGMTMQDAAEGIESIERMRMGALKIAKMAEDTIDKQDGEPTGI